DPAAGGRAPLDCADHADVGRYLGGDDVGAHAPPVLWLALSARVGGGGLLSRHSSLSDILGSGRRPGTGDRPLPRADGDPGAVRRTARRAAAHARRLPQAERLAVAVPAGRSSLRSAGLPGPQGPA